MEERKVVFVSGQQYYSGMIAANDICDGITSFSYRKIRLLMELE